MYLSLKDITNLHLAEIESAIKQVVESGWYLQGEATKRFENDYARYISSTADGHKGCRNGTAAPSLREGWGEASL